jgi:RNA polymerase sigma-70 factor, ECF subfamily
VRGSLETTLTRQAALALDLRSAKAAPAKTVQGLAAEEFDEIVRAHQQRIYRVLWGLLRDSDTADTLTQECFLRAYRKRKSFRGEANVGTWLVRIAVNLAADHRRSRRNAFWRRLLARAKSSDAAGAAPVAEELPDPRASPERQLAAREELRGVWSAANELSPQQRAVFVLRFAEEMTLEEIAQVTALEVGTVKAHLARALGAVRKRLKESRPHASTSDR